MAYPFGRNPNKDRSLGNTALWLLAFKRGIPRACRACVENASLEEIEDDTLSGRQFDADCAETNAGRVVPTFAHDDTRILQSLAIMRYLDDIQP